MKALIGTTRGTQTRRIVSTLAAALATAGLAANPTIGEFANDSVRNAKAASFAAKAAAKRAESHSIAKRSGWRAEGVHDNGNRYELLEMSADGVPVYNESLSTDVAVSSGSMELHSAGMLFGEGVNVGIWDQGAARVSHQEFTGVANREATGMNSHTTAVASIVAADGVNPELHGGAPAANVQVFNWGNDTGELTLNGAASPADTAKIQIANHSYGTTHGWAYGSYGGTTGWYWFGAAHSPLSDGGNREDANFGAYGYRAWQFDSLIYGAPYVLSVRAAGNDRDDVYGGPRDGSGTYYYTSNYAWASATWNANTAPFDEGSDQGGYDTIISDATAKNILTVGAVTSAAAGGVRTPSIATPAAYSAWGPADDGRVKPDLVAVGDNVRVAGSSNDQHYYGSSGTSFSAPAVSAAAAQVVDEARILFSGRMLPASTIKALLLHGATDIGNPGPDYIHGWGLLDAVGAIEPLLHQAAEPDSHALVESVLDAGSMSDTFSANWDGAEDLVVTICWTDAPGVPAFAPGLDDRTPTLVNDLDVRVRTADGTVHMPFTLDPANPAANAVPGDNVIDNVEQIVIPAGSAASGPIEVTVSAKSAPVYGTQAYSLVMSGQSVAVAETVIESVTPNEAATGSDVTVTVSGSNLPLGASLCLMRESHGTIYGETSVATATVNEGRFLLNDTAPGTWTIVLDLESGANVLLGEFEVLPAAPVAIFADGFETDMEDWTSVGVGTSPSPRAPGEGRYVARMGGGSAMETFVSTSGYKSLMLQYAVTAKRLRENEYLGVDYTIDGGETWIEFDRIDEDRPWTFRTVPVPASANGAAGFGIRFRCESGSGGTRVEIDEVTLLGIAQTAGTANSK